MAHAMGSKEATALLIDPMNAPEPSTETGPGSHFGSTFAPAQHSGSRSPATPPRTSLSSNNPFLESPQSKTKRSARTSLPSKSGTASSQPSLSRGSREAFPNYRAEAFGDFNTPSRSRSASGSGNRGGPPLTHNDPTSSAHASPTHRHRRRTSSLKARYPGDDSIHPLDIIRRDSKKAHRSPHLKKHHLPGADTIDRLDPSIGGHAYHHEGPYDAALLARNSSYENSPLAALESTNEETLKATPQENIRDAVERHRPLDGVAAVPPGHTDRLGRVYNYEEGADLMHEDNNDGPGYKRWSGKDYAPDDLKGVSEPSFSLNKAMKAHKITDSGIELSESSHMMKDYNKQNQDASPDHRRSVDVAECDDSHADAVANTHDNDASVRRSSSIRAGLKKRIGSLRKKNRDE